MEYVVVGVIAWVVLWLVLGKMRGDAYVRTVAQLVANDLRTGEPEPESAIKAYLNSAEFAGLG